jgi:hypothetical protein
MIRPFSHGQMFERFFRAQQGAGEFQEVKGERQRLPVPVLLKSVAT